MKEDWHGNTGFDPFSVTVYLEENGEVCGDTLLVKVLLKLQSIWDSRDAVEKHGLQNYCCKHVSGEHANREFRLLRPSGEVFVDNRATFEDTRFSSYSHAITSGSPNAPCAFIEFYDVSWRTYFSQMKLIPNNDEYVKDEESVDDRPTLAWAKIEPKPIRVERWEGFFKEEVTSQ